MSPRGARGGGHRRSGPPGVGAADEGAILETLASGVRALGLDLDPERLGRLLRYLRLLGRWGRAYNLSGPAALEDPVHRHLLDSLAVLPHVRGGRCLDVGTGAGLPGLVLAVAEPGRHWVLLDSRGKKVRFCRQVTLELGLQGVEVVQSRVEDYRPHLAFDTVTVRAWAAVPDVLARVWALVAPEGRLLIMRGALAGPELAAPPPGARVTVVSLRVPGLAARRHLVVLERCAPATSAPSPP